MKRECIYCSDTFDDNDGSICPHCSKDNNVDRLTERGIHMLHQNAHNNITKYTERKDSGMVFVVVGTLLLIIGALFLFLSFKYNTQRIRVFSPNSVEFITSIICLSLSVVSLGFGTFKLITSLKKIKFYKSVILDTDKR